ncbi:MAG: hypothetical protein LBB92_01815 [Endomicrobium sp.]|nr:hypothetical protein [Endomicrobium sp.]
MCKNNSCSFNNVLCTAKKFESRRSELARMIEKIGMLFNEIDPSAFYMSFWI